MYPLGTHATAYKEKLIAELNRRWSCNCSICFCLPVWCFHFPPISHSNTLRKDVLKIKKGWLGCPMAMTQGHVAPSSAGCRPKDASCSWAYRQPGLLGTQRNFERSSKFLEKQYFLSLRLPLRHFWAFPKIWRSHVFRVGHKRNFNLVDETLIFQGHLNVFWGSFMALLCSSRWSDHKCCKTEYVALKTSFQTSPMWAL